MTEPQDTDHREAEVTAAPAGLPPAPRTPRWVKITGVVVTLFVLGFLAKALFGEGGDGHGPGMHGGFGRLTPPPSSSASLASARATSGL